NEDDILVFGKFSGAEAQENHMRDALAFGPVLVSNGEPAPVTGASSGLNPRTAIGQRADGAVLMLVIDGRQATSLGATYADLIQVMLEYGAVNAVNLDGGSSSMLYFDGEYLNNGVALTGSRKLPTAFIVR
ncbi:MAG: phosphodiester glycosidase family protein, partial [Aristaeellaceae bacterium]